MWRRASTMKFRDIVQPYLDYEKQSGTFPALGSCVDVSSGSLNAASSSIICCSLGIIPIFVIGFLSSL